jgi:hypothetical protein
MPKNVPKKEHTGTFAISKLLPKTQVPMEHFKILIIPENLSRELLHYSRIG